MHLRLGTLAAAILSTSATPHHQEEGSIIRRELAACSTYDTLHQTTSGITLLWNNAANGDTEQALSILAQGTGTAYAASYAASRGDILLAAGRDDEARAAYLEARSLAAANPGQPNLSMLEQKLQSLTPVAPRAVTLSEGSDDPTLSVGEEG